MHIIYKNRDKCKLIQNVVNQNLSQKTLGLQQFHRTIREIGVPDIEIQGYEFIYDKYPYFQLSGREKFYNRKFNVNQVNGTNHFGYGKTNMICSDPAVINKLYEWDKVKGCFTSPIELIKVWNEIHIADGAHRFYAHLIMEEEEFCANVTVYNYSALLKKLKIIEVEDVDFTDTPTLYFDGKYIDYLDKNSYLRIKGYQAV